MWGRRIIEWALVIMAAYNLLQNQPVNVITALVLVVILIYVRLCWMHKDWIDLLWPKPGEIATDQARRLRERTHP